jgi:hypothetical protein
MHAADTACCKDTDPCEPGNGDCRRNRSYSGSFRCDRNWEIALGELLISGENERFVMRLNARPEFAIDDSSYSRHGASPANRSIDAIKALTVVRGGEAHL